jgi:hypothetical protein
MDLDQDDAVARGLRRYVRLVAEALGVGAEASIIQFDDPVSVYLALDRCSPQHPDQDLALLWDERQGWALGVENMVSADVLVLGCLTAEVLPSPSTVADYVAAACRGDGFGTAVPDATLPDAEGLAARLADYVSQVHDSGSSWLVPPGSKLASGR